MWMPCAARPPRSRGLVAATRGNHGQSIGFAAGRHGIPAAIVAPHGNSTGKNAAMKALGVELIEEGHDFQASLEAAERIAGERGWHMVPSFDPRLVQGVASYALELFRAVPDLDTLYVPIGLGLASAARLPRGTRWGSAPGSSRSSRPPRPRMRDRSRLGRPVSHETTTRIADGMACRTPVPDALDQIRAGIERVVRSHRRSDRGRDARDLRRHA
jgi:threonine dehydratase